MKNTIYAHKIKNKQIRFVALILRQALDVALAVLELYP